MQPQQLHLPNRYYVRRLDELSMTTGIVFDINEFAIHDGPGIRTTVFLKGCSLSCMWCHNPEGQSRQPQVIQNPSGIRIAGKEYTSNELAMLLNQQAEILRNNEGGVTFSGGEPLMQADFVIEVIDLLEDVHILLDTSGYGSEGDFRKLVERSDLVFFDLKIIDQVLHRHFTGCDNSVILSNLHLLNEMGTPYVIRVPLVPGVTDTHQNIEDIIKRVRGLLGLLRVDLLPYNKAAGSKYKSAGMIFKPEYDESQEPNLTTELFSQAGIQVAIA